eukprot:GHVQ01028772.1.p1 GENE.GHVQ01028772.1~~GHVQ01028772.1.p1  ORF type:complete len:705 (+),score=182.45 GHVQ01028772.1:260-2374(+)
MSAVVPSTRGAVGVTGGGVGGSSGVCLCEAYELLFNRMYTSALHVISRGLQQAKDSCREQLRLQQQRLGDNSSCDTAAATGGGAAAGVSFATTPAASSAAPYAAAVGSASCCSADAAAAGIAGTASAAAVASANSCLLWIGLKVYCHYRLKEYHWVAEELSKLEPMEKWENMEGFGACQWLVMNNHSQPWNINNDTATTLAADPPPPALAQGTAATATGPTGQVSTTVASAGTPSVPVVPIGGNNHIAQTRNHQEFLQNLTHDNKLPTTTNNTGFCLSSSPSRHEEGPGAGAAAVSTPVSTPVSLPFLLHLIRAYLPIYAGSTGIGGELLAMDRLYVLLDYTKAKLAQALNDIAATSASQRPAREEGIPSSGSSNGWEGIKGGGKKINKQMVVQWEERLTAVCVLLCDVLVMRHHLEDALELLQSEVMKRRAPRPPPVGCLSLLGRIALQLGAVDAAEEYFGYAECLSDKRHAVTVHTNSGMLAMASITAVSKKTSSNRDPALLGDNKNHSSGHGDGKTIGHGNETDNGSSSSTDSATSGAKRACSMQNEEEDDTDSINSSCAAAQMEFDQALTAALSSERKLSVEAYKGNYYSMYHNSNRQDGSGGVDSAKESNVFCPYPDVTAVCGSNLSVSYLYGVRLSEASDYLQRSVGEECALRLYPTALKNLNILYEFSSNKQECLSTLREVIDGVTPEDADVTTVIT